MKDNRRYEAGISYKKLYIILIFVVGGMFGFGFALIPLYNTFCRVTGLNGKTSGRYIVHPEDRKIDYSRSIKVQFTTTVNESMPWNFFPNISSVDVHPGEMKQVSFTVFNQTNSYIIGRAIPSISPGLAARYLHKTECFCFNEQPLAAHETKAMPLVFFLDHNIPQNVKRLTLSYTMFDTKKPPSAMQMAILLRKSAGLHHVSAN